MSTTRQHIVRAGAFGVKDAIRLAEQAHAGQTDLSGQPYLDHVRRVADAVAAHGDEVQMAAWLHDVVEDSVWTLDTLRSEGVPQKVLEALDALTERPGEGYEDFVRRAAAHPMARLVKLADNRDNADEHRLNRLELPVAERFREKYARARKILASTAL